MLFQQHDDIDTSLHENEFRQHTFLENASVGIFIAKNNGQISLINAAGCRIFGYSERELLKMTLSDLIVTKNLQHHSGWFEDLQAGRKIQIEYQFPRHKDGLLVTVELNAKRLPDGNIQGIIQDVTHRKRMESQLRSSEARFRSLVEQSPFSTAIYQPNGNLILFNKACCELWRMPSEQAEKMLGTYNILQDEQLENQGLMPFVKKGFAGQVSKIPMFKYVPEQHTVDQQSPPGTQWIRGYIYPVKDETGNVLEVVVLHEDVTERQRIEEMLREAQRQDSLGILAGGVAHDFNNLLVAMLGQISLAQAKLPAASAAQEHIKKAISAAEHAAELTRQLLAYSGKGRFEVAAVNLNKLVQDNLHLLRVSIPKNVSLSLNPDPNLPFIDGDAGQIQQLIMNLIINGAEAIGERSGTVSLTTGVQEFKTVNPDLWRFTGRAITPGRYVCFTVSDDGTGMDAETLGHIFDPFFTTKPAGRGLGLSAVLGIMRGQSGGLSIDSVPEEGTTFRLYFPVSQSDDEASDTNLPTYEQRAAEQAGFVLVIDDEKAVREAIVDVLDLTGLKVMTAENGEAGLAIYRERQAEIPLVILDLTMPGLSGFETLSQLKKINPQAKVLLSSGYSQQEMDQQIDTADFAGFLQKPYSMNQFIQVIHNLLN